MTSMTSTLPISNRNPLVKSLIPRTPKGIPKPKVASNKLRYNGPVYLPNHILDMLSEAVKKELDKYNREKKANYQPINKRMAKVHEHSHRDEGLPENAEPDLETYDTEDSYPMQESDIEELINSDGGYSAKMAFSYHISKHSASSYQSVVDSRAGGGLAGADVCSLERNGKVNMLMHEYAYYGRGITIHSHCQIKWFHNKCDDKSHHGGGKQVITS